MSHAKSLDFDLFHAARKGSKSGTDWAGLLSERDPTPHLWRYRPQQVIHPTSPRSSRVGRLLRWWNSLGGPTEDLEVRRAVPLLAGCRFESRAV